MRIENKGIVISEIFEGDDGETIEIDVDSDVITLNLFSLLTDDGKVSFTYSTKAFRQLLNAMKRADQEIEQVKNPMAAS